MPPHVQISDVSLAVLGLTRYAFDLDVRKVGNCVVEKPLALVQQDSLRSCSALASAYA
jgi:hypothetical protein